MPESIRSCGERNYTILSDVVLRLTACTSRSTYDTCRNNDFLVRSDLPLIAICVQCDAVRLVGLIEQNLSRNGPREDVDILAAK